MRLYPCDNLSNKIITNIKPSGRYFCFQTIFRIRATIKITPKKVNQTLGLAHEGVASMVDITSNRDAYEGGVEKERGELSDCDLCVVHHQTAVVEDGEDDEVTRQTGLKQTDHVSRRQVFYVIGDKWTTLPDRPV